MDFSAIRSRLASSEGRLYWRSLGELSDSPQFREYLHREFPEQASEWNDPKGRREFLKLMSASLALAGVGACTRQPQEQIVPYVRQPENVVRGRPPWRGAIVGTLSDRGPVGTGGSKGQGGSRAPISDRSDYLSLACRPDV